MARRTALLIRMLLSLALIVAAMPLRASAPPCPPEAPRVAKAIHAQACAMPCCAGKLVEMACCKSKVSVATFAKACACEIKAAPDALPATESKVVLPAFVGLLATLPSEAPRVGAIVPAIGEPGVFGTDSGPPSTAFYASVASRAPPVVCV